MQIKIDCKYYIGSKPCKYHKVDRRLCENCTDYRKAGTRILIVKLDALGDVLRTTSILPSIHRKYPDSHITWITKRNSESLLKNNYYIDRLLYIENNYLDFILKEEFDIGICLDAENLSAAILSNAGCKEKLGFIINSSGQLIPANEEATAWYLMGLNDDLKKRNRATYQKLIYNICKLDGEIYKPQFQIDDNIAGYSELFKENKKLNKYKIIIGINTGGGSRWECKSWVREYYADLINKLQNYKNDIGIILFGGEKEKELIDKIKKEISAPVIDAECYDSVSKFAGIINLVDTFLTPDSLGFHLSVALGKYSIVLVGPTSPWELDVYGNGEIVFEEGLDCIACYDSICRRNKECMKSITPDIIFEKIIKRINEVSNS